MANTNWVDKNGSEILSTHINGMQDSLKKLETALNMGTTTETNIAMTNISNYRIYEAPVGKRNWVISPAPVVKKNGNTITTGFTIDYAGGALIFSPALTSSDVIKVDATYINNTSTANKYFWTEEKTVNAGSNSFTLTNTVQSYMKLLIKDKTYVAEWLEGIHWNRNGQVITLTESALLETLTFRIMAV